MEDKRPSETFSEAPLGTTDLPSGIDLHDPVQLVPSSDNSNNTNGDTPTPKHGSKNTLLLEQERPMSGNSKPNHHDAPTSKNTSENNLLLEQEQLMSGILKPHHHDVLCGRGVTTNRWNGNENFRAIVGLNKETYVSSSKREKMKISRSIVHAIRSLHPPGRFLDKDTDGTWFDVGDKKAIEKTSQALRDGAAMLRKQLSADLNDPSFLNSVFSEDTGCSEKQQGGQKKGRVSGKENNKGKSPEKPKPVKAKSSTIKKGHRRVKSNPSCGLGGNKAARKGKLEEPLDDPGRYPRPNYGMFPPTPHSPGPHIIIPPRHARSLPNSPMTWGGGPPPSYPESSGGYSSHHPHHSPYHQPSPQTFSPYGKPSNHAPPYGRSHSFEYHPHGPPPPSDTGHSPRHHSWSPYGGHPPPSPYHNPTHYYHHHPPTLHVEHVSSSPPRARPMSPPPNHHKYPSVAYYSKHGATPEWSPRRVNHHPGHYYSPRRGEYTPSRSASWTPRTDSSHCQGEHLHHHGYPEEDDDSDGLAVPSLGESRTSDSEKLSSKVHLAPRMKPVSAGSMKTPPRPPIHSRHRAFSPPMSPNLQRSKLKEDRIIECSPIKEEKKSPDLSENEEQETPETTTDMGPADPYPPISASSVSSIKLDVPIKIERSDAKSNVVPTQELQQRDSSEVDSQLDDLSEMRASPGFMLSVDEDGNVEAMPRMDETCDGKTSEPLNNSVEDITMSPIAYDQEDPITLMDLPENLLSLPISPCGPNDDPAVGCFRC